MARFKCTNKECPNFDMEVFIPKVTFMWNETIHELIIKNHPVCCNCGEAMKIQKEETNGKIECNFLKFDSLSSDEKKARMKKRYQEHSKKEVKDKVHEVRKSILGDDYKLIPKGQ